MRRLGGALAVVAGEVQEEGVDRDQDLSAFVGHEGRSTGLGQRLEEDAVEAMGGEGDCTSNRMDIQT